jgi:hypothetical protein
MRLLASSIVDWATLGKVLVASLVAGVGVTVVFSLAIVGATRFVELRRNGKTREAGGYGLLLMLSLVAVAAAVVLGIVVMARKR